MDEAQQIVGTIKMRRCLLPTAAFLLVAIAACSGGDSSADRAIRNDLQRYLKQLSIIGDIEVEANKANQDATSRPGATDASYAVALRGMIIPKFEEFGRELGRIHPTTDEMLGLHRILLQRGQAVIAGHKELEQSTRGGGGQAIQRANDHFADARVYFQRWSDQMDELKKRYSKAK